MPERLRPRRLRGDDGFTLVEMITVMIVFSVVLGLVFPAVVLVQRKVSDLDATASSVAEVRIALQNMDRQARSGNVLYSPAAETTTGCTGNAAQNAGTCMRIFTQANGLQKCVQWQVIPDAAGSATSTLRTRSWEQDWVTSPVGAVSGWQVVARGLVTPGSDGTPRYPFVLQGAGTPYQARLLDVRLEATDKRRRAPTVLTSSLSGRNTNYGYDPGVCSPVPPA
ncbi:type II secretion system protein [Aquipuribacter nitratireducens]|uniref:Type II secretion system protein n=1 Tax=Aquipuribacter nitratireducens TaxID=650104 RepID=A0ABW0GQW1_9MICO